MQRSENQESVVQQVSTGSYLQGSQASSQEVRLGGVNSQNVHQNMQSRDEQSLTNSTTQSTAVVESPAQDSPPVAHQVGSNVNGCQQLVCVNSNSSNS